MRVILVHGFNVSDGGARTIDLMIPHLEAAGHEVVQFDYGWRGLLGVRFMSKNDARALMRLYRDGDVVIGHSNGGHIIAIAIELGMPVEHVIMIHPALDTDWAPPEGHPVKEVYVYYSSRDKATWWSQFSPWKWGGMGTYGPTSDDSRMIGLLEDQTHSGGFVEHPKRYFETLGNG